MTLLFCVELQGGLANRLRALWSAHAFALRYHRSVLVIWPVCADLGCPAELLFRLNSPLHLIQVKPDRRLDRWLLRLARWLLSSLRLGLNKPVIPGQPWGDPPRYAPRGVPFQWIQTCAEFEDSTGLPAPFQPESDLLHAAKDRLASARHDDAPLIGLHVRRADHQLATAHSQTSHFLEAMQARLRDQPSTRFLLCTDDPQEVACFEEAFGERLSWFPPACLDRAQTASGPAAMIDLLTLSGCDAILGSYLSSFSLLAARYGGIPLEIVEAQEPSPSE